MGRALLMVALAGELDWEAPAGCPTAAEVEAAVERLLADDAVAREPATGRIVASARGYELTVSVGEQTRVVEADACAPLGDVAALVIAVAHDPVAVAASVAEVEANAVETVPELEPTVRTEEIDRVASEASPNGGSPRVRSTRTGSPRDRSRRDRPVRAGASPFIALGGGELPGVGVGFGLGIAALGRKWWRVEIVGTGWLPRRANTREAPELGADVFMAGASLRGCGVPRAGSVEFPLCIGAELDAWIAAGRGPGLSNPRQVAQLYAAALASAGASVVVRPWLALVARAELLVSIDRPAVRLDGVGFVFRAHPVAGRLVLGPELRFP